MKFIFPEMIEIMKGRYFHEKRLFELVGLLKASSNSLHSSVGNRLQWGALWGLLRTWNSRKPIWLCREQSKFLFLRPKMQDKVDAMVCKETPFNIIDHPWSYKTWVSTGTSKIKVPTQTKTQNIVHFFRAKTTSNWPDVGYK